jgi:hypothetical protein
VLVDFFEIGDLAAFLSRTEEAVLLSVMVGQAVAWGHWA